MLPVAEALRPVLPCAAVGFAAWRGRSVDGFHLLALTALLLLVFSPLDLYSAGFQLGFVIVAGMMLMLPPALRGCEVARMYMCMSPA